MNERIWWRAAVARNRHLSAIDPGRNPPTSRRVVRVIPSGGISDADAPWSDRDRRGHRGRRVPGGCDEPAAGATGGSIAAIHAERSAPPARGLGGLGHGRIVHRAVVRRRPCNDDSGCGAVLLLPRDGGRPRPGFHSVLSAATGAPGAGERALAGSPHEELSCAAPSRSSWHACHVTAVTL